MTEIASQAYAVSETRPLWRRAWSLLVAIKDGLALILLLLFFGVLYMLLSSGPNPADNRGGALLMTLDGAIVEQPETPDPRALILGQVPSGNQYRLRDVVRALETAAKDSAIKAVVMDLSGFDGGGQASLHQVGQAIDKVRATKKPVLVHATGYMDGSYQIAAHASEIWLDPMGAAMFPGRGGVRPYYKGLIDKLGITTHVYRVGKFKSFVEPYLRADQSPEAKEADKALAGSLWQMWQDDVTKARPKAKIATFASDPAGTVKASGGDMSKTAIDNGIVDKLGDRAAFGTYVAKIVGADDSKPAGDFNNTAFPDYLAANPESSRGEPVGVITIAGGIVDGNAPSGTAGGDTIANLIDKAVAEESLKALVVRVDSPGGSAVASEQIRAAILRAKATKIPVVVSMANVAASGGYWVAMTGDKIFAEPSTITGSIGVFGIIPTFENTAKKFGISGDGVTTTPLSGQPDILRGTNEQTDYLLQSGVEDIYRRFLSIVSTARKMPVERVNEIAQGRVWDGGTARQIGLVDAFGSIDDAVNEAAKLAKIDTGDVRRIYIEPRESFLGSIFGNLVSARAATAPRDIFTHMIRRQQGEIVAGVNDAQQILSGPAIQVRCTACASPAPARGWQSLFKIISDRVFL